MELGISDEVLQVHGVAPLSKGEGVVRLIYENMNGLSNKLSNNKKVNLYYKRLKCCQCRRCVSTVNSTYVAISV